MNNRETKEYILCSAIWFDDGVRVYPNQPINVNSGYVVCGRRHHDCFEISIILSGRDRDKSIGVTQGFLTNKDRFVDREEAARIAFSSGQIKEEKSRLYSEDVW